MPVSYIQGPSNNVTTPNAAYTRLPHRITTDDSTRPQYQFIMDIYESGSSEYITRHTQGPNDGGAAIFDPSRVIQGVLDYDQYWKITGSIEPNNSVKDFVLQFGEQYGSSPSSSVLVYPNQASHELTIFPGVVNPMEKEYLVADNPWNFYTSSFTTPLNNPYLTNAPYAFNNPTTEFPASGYHGLMNSEDYFTATIFGDTFLTPAEIRVRPEKFVNGQKVGGVADITIPLSPPSGSFNTIGLGPKNLAELSPTFSASLAAGDINFIYTYNDFGGISYYINDKWDGIAVNLTPTEQIAYTGETFKKCSDEYTRFAFINQYGFWDYYNIYNPVKIETDLDRKTWNRPQVAYDFIGVGYFAPYTGFTQDYLSSTDRHSVDTDYITKETANWLEELIQSPEVFVQQGDNFVPIVLTNSSYESNNSTARNKLFKYTIEWVYANPRRSRI